METVAESVMLLAYPPEDMLLIVRAWLALIGLVIFLMVQWGLSIIKVTAKRPEPPVVDASVINLRLVARHRAHPYMARSERLEGLVTR